MMVAAVFSEVINAIIVWVLLGNPWNSEQRLRPHSLPELDQYERVVDRLFEPTTQVRADEAYLIRCTPCKDQELQILFRPTESGFHVERWRPRRGDPSIWLQLRRMKDASRSGEMTLDAAVAAIAVDHDQVELSSTSEAALLLRRGLTLAIPASGSSAIVLDGSYYRFVADSMGRRMVVTQFASDIIAASDPFVRWLLDVSSLFEKPDMPKSR